MKTFKTLLLFVAVLLAVFLGLWIVQDNPEQTAITLLGFPLWVMPLGLWILSMCLFTSAKFFMIIEFDTSKEMLQIVMILRSEKEFY